MPDDIVINSLLAAISAQPNSVELRLHTAPMLIEAGRDAEAMELLSKVLELQPTNLDALRLAAGCSRRLNDLTRAIAFEQILNAMQMQSAQSLIESAGIDFKEPPRGELVELRESESDYQGNEPSTALDFERPELTLQDVKGLKEVKERLEMAFLAPLRNPELRKLYGKSLKG
ncbi:MAG TPA: hypothetical protein VK171_17335, partial [Fimbriimonas sp.]|nr:hypothetical protein [Fimbriimonas sp.]